MSLVAQTQAQPLGAVVGVEPEIWYTNDHWSSAPLGYYLGPDSRVLSPSEFADYSRNPRRFILVFGRAQEGSPAGEALA